MDDPYQRIQQDTQKLKQDVADAIAQAKEEARLYAGVAGQTAKDTAKAAGVKAREAGIAADLYAREHAWLVAGAAALIGLVVGLLLNARRDRD